MVENDSVGILNNMADDLNIPADFMKPKSKCIDMSLLPPSAFTAKVKDADPWKEITQVNEEIAKLKLENSKIREVQQQALVPVTVPKQEQHRQEICQYKSRKEDLRYIDELINKQASEISELKREIQELKSKHKDEVTELEREITRKERDFHHSVTSLEADLKAAESRYELQVDRLSREHEMETQDLNSAISKLEAELSHVRVQSGKKIEDLESKYLQLKETSQADISELTEQLKSKETLVQSQLNQIKSLKKYIGETENTVQSKSMSKKERETLSARLKQCEDDKKSLNSTLQLLNIRLNSINEILNLQEKEMCKSSSTDKSKQESLLLTRWREKVFALMVQAKSTAIVSKNDENNWKSKIEQLENKLSTAQNHIQQLTHNLSDKDAQLNIERNTSQKLQADLSEAQQLALCLDDQLQANYQQTQALQSAVESIMKTFQENCDVHTSAMASIKAFGQRINFASGRIDMLQGLFARKEALLKLQMENVNIPVKDVTNPDEQREEQTFLAREVERVTKERDNLACQIKVDAQAWDDKVLAIRKQFEDEIQDLKQSNADLEQIVKEKSQKYLEECEKLEICQNDLQYANQTVDELKSTLAKQEMNMEQLLDEQKREVENQKADQFADLDRQMNEAKREHAKAVVSLRQLERQTTREKERMTEHLNTVEEYYKGHISKMEQHIKAVEKERNLMMATLRQEGLIGRLKSDRSEPATRTWDEVKDDNTEVQDDNIPVKDTVEPSVTMLGAPDQPFHQIEDTDEPLTAVLEDLQSLTDAVLKDEDSGSEV